MQSITLLTLACVVVTVSSISHYEHYPAVEALSLDDTDTPDSIYSGLAHDRTHRTKRSLILLKKKLILGALGLKAAKVGALGTAGVVGAVALSKNNNKKSVHKVYVVPYTHDGYYGHSSWSA